MTIRKINNNRIHDNNNYRNINQRNYNTHRNGNNGNTNNNNNGNRDMTIVGIEILITEEIIKKSLIIITEEYTYIKYKKDFLRRLTNFNVGKVIYLFPCV